VTSITRACPNSDRSVRCDSLPSMDSRDRVVRYNEGLLRLEKSSKTAALQRLLHVQDLRYETFLSKLDDDNTINSMISHTAPPTGVAHTLMRQKRLRACRTRNEAFVSQKSARRY
ncbi:hypothetical protein Pmar_PMAR005859, partial [Perkinsus marinus ATCC 50983]